MVAHCLKVGPDDIGEYVLLPGDPGRVEVVTDIWDKSWKVAANREFVTYTGEYKGVRMSCVSTGIGAPSASIALEELARLGAHTFLRIGTCGTYQREINVGDIAIFDSAVRFDGASARYAPIEYPAAANVDVVVSAREAAKRLGVPAHVGTTRSADTLYARHPKPGSSFGGYWQSNWREEFEDLRRMRVIAAEMEASIILVLARLWGLRGGGMAVVVNNEFDSGEEFDPDEEYSMDAELIHRLVRTGSETLRIVAEEVDSKDPTL